MTRSPYEEDGPEQPSARGPTPPGPGGLGGPSGPGSSAGSGGPPGYPEPRRRRVTGWAIPLGIVGFIALNFAAFLLAISLASRLTETQALVVAAALLAGIAVLGGALMTWLGHPIVRGLGIGLMIGWAVMSLVTAGFCTGLNPNLYGEWVG